MIPVGGLYFILEVGTHTCSSQQSEFALQIMSPSFLRFLAGMLTRVGVDYKSPITITVPIKLSITITVVIEKAITITIIRLRLQLLVYHGNDSRLFIRHVHLQYYHA